MSWIKRFAVCAAAIGALAVSGATAKADFARGKFNDWAADCPMEKLGDDGVDTSPCLPIFYSATYQAHPSKDTDPGLKFDVAGDWGAGGQYVYGLGESAIVNTSIGRATGGGTHSNLAMEVTSGYYYTFHLAGDYKNSDRRYLVMKTQYPPSRAVSVTDDSLVAFDGADVHVTATLAASNNLVSPEETYYIVWAPGGWNGDGIKRVVPMTGTGLVRYGTIPGQQPGIPVSYTVCNSTMPTNLFTDDILWNNPREWGGETAWNNTTADLDQRSFCMLSVTESRYYESRATKAWHCPTNCEPWDGTEMRDPFNVAAGDSPYIRLGGYPRSGWEPITAANLHYKVDNGAWKILPMGGEDNSQGLEAFQNNAYWTNALPKAEMTEGAVVKYYFDVDFSPDWDAQFYLGTTNQLWSQAYLDETNAQAHPFQFTVAPKTYQPGNVWHIPASAEVADKTMRDPANPGEGNEVKLYLGNQSDYQDGWMTSANVKYRVGTSGAWTSLPLGWEEGAGGSGSQNAFWTNSLPAVNEGQTVQYYFEALFADSSVLGTTYVYTTNNGTGCAKAMEEADAQASPFSYTATARVYNLGNCWHIPANAEPAGTYMRNPTHPYASSDVWIYNGNQASGDGNPGDQNGGVVYYRKAGTTAWSETNMWFDTAIENNKFWHSRIPANAFSATESVEYVIKVTYADHDDTYLGLAAAGDTASSRFGTLEAAAAHPFDFTYAGEAGQEPAFVWHGGNAVKISGTNVQLWVKTGYVQGDDAWADQAQIRYKVVVPDQQSTTARQGVRAIPRKKGARAVDPSLTQTVEMRFDHTEEDPSGIGKAMWWVGSVTNTDLAAAGAVLRYQIAVRRTTAGGGNGTWRLAEYQAGGANDTVFEYTMASSGANTLTVNGLNADYTTSKFFIDESKGETAHLHVVYSAPAGATDVQIFSNVGRRDYWGADLDGNGVPDAIRPPSGDLVTPANTATTNTYFGAWAMTWDADAGVYTWDADIGKTGAYRLTARYKKDGTWHYYSELGSGIRDHAIVISPKKVLEQNVYEVNGLTAKASAPTLEGHSTFDDLIEGADGYAEFGIPYLNNIGANCLWFQPIHTSSGYGLKEGYLPGSPYAAKDYFTVSKWYGKSQTTEGALEEFQHFVSACDAGRSGAMISNDVPSKVGTINIMLDGVFNHTSWDAVVGEFGRQFLAATNYTRFTNENHQVETITADTAIGKVLPGWYANCSDYGAPATFYYGPEGGRHDIASGPDRGDFGKWLDTAELFYGNYSALVRHNPDDNGNYLNESDSYDYTSMTRETEWLWEYMGAYVPYWLEQTGHDFGNERMGQVDANGTAYDDYGIDGLRCDFGQGLPPQFWEYCINRARAKKWNFMFMAESLDGGKVSYRSNRHFDILNESFVFAARNAGNPSDLLAVTDDKKAAYNGGAVLLNLTSHDEVMPYSDPWKTASRYAMLATVKGLPMTMYGQEQGIVPLVRDSAGVEEGTIVMPGERWTGFAKFELNFGKWVADFKTWNKLTIWDEPAMGDGTSFEASHGMARLYGQINWARQGSPALQSDVQWMLDTTDGWRSGDIWAMAKAEDYGALAQGKDAVLAFVLFVKDQHEAKSATFAISADVASFLGLEDGVSYTARNLAATDPTASVWPAPKTKTELMDEGVWVNFPADQNGSAFYNDGAMVQFLKLEKHTDTPDPESIPADGGKVAVETSWLRVYWPDASVAELEDIVNSTASNKVDTVWQCYIADIDPTDPNSRIVVGQDIDLSNGVSFKVNIPAGRTAEVCYKDDMTGATQENWQSFDDPTAACYSNEGPDDYDWTFIDPTWDGTAIRFYQLQMRLNP